MPVSLRLLDATAAGTQTLRLVTALVCSISVTTAVAGPMAYQAIEFRRTHDGAIAIEQPALVEGPVAPGASGPQTGVLDESMSRVPPAARVAVTSTTVTVTVPASAAPTTAAPVAASTPAAPDAARPAATAPTATTPAATAPTPASAPPTAAAPTTAAPVPTTDPAVVDVAATPPPATPTVATTAPPAAATDGSAGNPFDEFNPREACADNAQELNTDRKTDCPPP